MNKQQYQTPKTSFMARYGMVFLTLAIILFFNIFSDRFLTGQNFGNMLITQVTVGFVALGGMFILTVNEFDLSLGYIVTFSMVAGAKIADIGGPAWLVILTIFAAGTICGLINGLCVVKLDISAFIVTLSMGLAVLGLAQALSGGARLNKNIPAILTSFSQGKWGYVGYCVVFWLVVCVLMYILFNHTTFGRQIYAIGSSKHAAYLAGIRTDRVRILCFTLAGFFSSLAAAILFGQLGAASSAYGHTLLLPAYSMVFLSKSSFKPGYCNITGLVLSILFVGIGSNGMKIIGMPSWSSYVYEGGILIVAILLANQFSRKNKEIKS